MPPSRRGGAGRSFVACGAVSARGWRPLRDGRRLWPGVADSPTHRRDGLRRGLSLGGGGSGAAAAEGPARADGARGGPLPPGLGRGSGGGLIRIERGGLRGGFRAREACWQDRLAGAGWGHRTGILARVAEVRWRCKPRVRRRRAAFGCTLSDPVAPRRVDPQFRSVVASNVFDAVARETGIGDPSRPGMRLSLRGADAARFGAPPRARKACGSRSRVLRAMRASARARKTHAMLRS